MGWGSRWRCLGVGLIALLAAACGQQDSSPPPAPADASTAAAPPVASALTAARPDAPIVRDTSYDLIPAPVLYDALEQRFGLKVRIPEPLKVCGPAYYQSVRAVWTRLDGSDCESKGPSLGYYGDYVMEDVNPAQDALAYAKGACAKPVWAPARWRRAVAGLETAMCRDDKLDGSIEIMLYAVAGKQAAEKGGTIAQFAYRFSLGTTAARYEQDVAAFDDFLSRTELKDNAGGCCGPLGQIPPPHQ